MQAETVILLIERKLSRRCFDSTIVILLKQDCKWYSAKKAAKLLQRLWKWDDRRKAVLADFACHLFNPNC